MNKISLALAASSITLSAHAYQADDFIVRGGIASVNPNVDSGELNTVPNGKVDVDSNSQLGLSFTYMVAENVGIEVLAATPFKHTLQGKGTIAALDDIAEVKHLPPTVSVQYYPMPSQSAFQPYAGIGLNYTFFFSEDLKGASDAAFEDLKLDSSLGLSGQLGFDYKIDQNWSLNAAVWYMDINTTAEFKTRSDGTKNKIDVELDPWVYMAGVSYRF